MLEQSKNKNLYNDYIQADLTKSLPIKAERYGAFLSAGTFTEGHVGPEALEELLRVAKPNALFCLGINVRAFDKYGFGSAFALLQADKKITPAEFVKTRYYDNTTQGGNSNGQTEDKHANDSYSQDSYSQDYGLTAVFRKV